MGNHFLYTSELVNEFLGGFLAHSWDAGNIVGAVAPKAE